MKSKTTNAATKPSKGKAATHPPGAPRLIDVQPYDAFDAEPTRGLFCRSSTREHCGRWRSVFTFSALAGCGTRGSLSLDSSANTSDLARSTRPPRSGRTSGCSGGPRALREPPDCERGVGALSRSARHPAPLPLHHTCLPEGSAT